MKTWAVVVYWTILAVLAAMFLMDAQRIIRHGRENLPVDSLAN